ncbi:unknown [Blautia sp. CAG:257]|nr:unknown [Blautia sp. CAG:257]
MDFIFHSLGMSSTGIKILGDLVQIGTDFTVLPDQLPKYFDVCDNFIMNLNWSI